MYDIRDSATGNTIAHIAESPTGIIVRNLLRTRRAFNAVVLDLEGNTILKIHRPIKWLLNSAITVTDHLDSPMGSVVQSFHVWYRVIS